MFRCLPEFGNCFNYMYDQKSTDGIFIFHGFPSQKNRNKDLAFELFNKTNASVFVHHYEGIGESLGRFYFKNSIPNAIRYVEHIKNEFGLQRIHFLGHSWGGFVSLNLLPKFKSQLGSVVLYSPFTQLPLDDGVDELTDTLMQEYPHLFFHREREQICAEFREMQQISTYRQDLASQNWQGPTLILQAKNDASTPADKTKMILPLLGKNVQYQELDIDHSFTEKRQNTFDLTTNFYKDINLHSQN
jgi:pimeloyl-ACP methyl ester carboxylesterase